MRHLIILSLVSFLLYCNENNQQELKVKSSLIKPDILYSPENLTKKKWLVLPIRSQQEYEQNLIGGEAEQHLHGITRSLHHPRTIYLSHDVAGVWRSDNAGDSWTKTPDKGLYVIHGQSIQTDPLDPDIVLLIADNSYNRFVKDFEGLYRSEDKGETWQLVLQTKTNYIPRLHRINRQNITYVYTGNKGTATPTWFAAFPDNGIYASHDNGKTWSKRLFSLKGHKICYSLKAAPYNPSHLYLGTDKGLFVSSDGGMTFTKNTDIENGAVTSIEIAINHPQKVYAALKHKGIYLSENRGNTFRLLKACPVTRIFINPAYGNVLYAVQKKAQMIISVDSGKTWYPANSVNPAKGLDRNNNWKKTINGELTGIVPNPVAPAEAVVYSHATIWKTTDSGKTFFDSSTLFTGFAWSWWNKGISFDHFDPSRFAMFNNDVGMTLTCNKGLYFEKYNRQAWRWFKEGKIPWIGTYSGAIQPVKGSAVIVASIGGYFKTKIVRSGDAGKTWVMPDNQGPALNLFIAFNTAKPHIVYAGNKISHDEGKTFKPVNFGQFERLQPEIIGMCLKCPDTIYALDKNRTVILRSDTTGRTWEQYGKPGWSLKKLDSLPAFAVHPVNPNIIYTIDKTGDLAVFDGKKWKITGVLALAGGKKLGNFVRSVAVDPRHPNIIYAGMYAAGISCIWRSRDNGKSWEDITYNLPRVGFSTMAVNPHTGELFHGSLVGTWIFQPPY